MDIENDYFLASFWSQSDYDKAITGGPWVIFRHYLVVEPWTVDFSSSHPYPSHVMAWIHFSGLPVTLYQRSMITTIGECIGSVIKLNYEITCGRRGCFACMTVIYQSRFNPIFEEGTPVELNLHPATSTDVVSLPATVPIEPVDVGTFDAPNEEVVPPAHKGSMPASAMTRGKEPMRHVSKPAKQRSAPKKLSSAASHKVVIVQLPSVGPSSKPSLLNLDFHPLCSFSSSTAQVQ
ncbi:hypothetical protein V6N12_034532 [Hibiscus sabdariffa]|uniref:DUF4283 domain-containing protein n=1 Tax=Hibiscus sabdariffa TaxID=183260 RepID=A0ABR2DIF4_9ROSI